VAVVSEYGELAASRIPREAPTRLLWLQAFKLAVERDAAATRAAMAFEGWVDSEARTAYGEWLHRMVDDALDQGRPT
jgi:hypothetical protein